jgi:bisphosphoglycerate-independent phosphoglycerate mutase (AlkP superfamily)
MTKGADIPLNGEQNVKNQTALTADITQESWRENLQLDVPVITPEQAAKRLINQSVRYDLLLHEYYLTDKAGHNRQKGQASKVLKRYDQFLWALTQYKPKEATLVLSSDHGNIEDLSTKSHTLNKVPLFAYGQGATLFHQAESIMDVTPGILEAL